MKRWIWVGCLLGGGVWGVQAQAPGSSAPPAHSLCTRLAAEMREAPASHWASSDPLSRWVVRAEGGSPFAEYLRSDPVWLAELGAEPNQRVRVSHLQDSPLHLVDSVEGTAHCQNLVALAWAQTGHVPRRLALPFELDLESLCTTRSAKLVRVMGEPTFMVGGAPSMTSPEREYRLAAWAGEAWGPSCSLRWTLRTEIRAGQRFCLRRGKPCMSGQALALRVAQAYEASRHTGQRLDVRRLNDGREPPASIRQALLALVDEPDNLGYGSPPFPTFGAKDTDGMLRLSFSYADPERLPLWLDGRWWLAAVGRSGLAWRQTDAVLVSLFALPGREADAVASYQFLVQTTGLQQVSASGD